MRYAPNIPGGVCFGRQLELWVGNQVNDFVGREEVTLVEVDSSLALPNYYLPNRETRDYVRSILEQPILYPPFVVVEDSSGWLKDTHHRGQTLPLPFNVFFVRHRVIVFVIAID